MSGSEDQILMETEDVSNISENVDTEMKDASETEKKESKDDVVTELTCPPSSVPVPEDILISTGIVSITCVADIPKIEEHTSIASSCPTVMAALMSPLSRSLSCPSTPVIPGTKDSEGFLTPPPASTLLLRRTRTNSTGSSTYVIASSCATSSSSASNLSSLSANGSTTFQSPSRKPYVKRTYRDRDGNLIPRSHHRKPKLDGKLNTILSAPTSHRPNSSSSGHSTVFGNPVHPPYRSSVISPLALNPPQSLSVTISAQRSVSTFSSALSPANNAPSSSFSFSTPKEPRGVKPQVSRGKPSYITEHHPALGGKGAKSRPDRVSSDGKEVKRKSFRRKRFGVDKKGSRYRNRHLSASSFVFDREHMGVWRPTDDLRLIVNVLQTNDLRMVHRGIKFACLYTFANLESRWAALVYDPAISKVTQGAIQKLHPKIVQSVYKAALFSKDEHTILKSIKSTHDIKCLLPKMEKLLHDNPMTFLKWRTPKILYEEWLLLKDCQLLCDQNIRKYFEHDSFIRFEDTVADRSLLQTRDRHTRHELLIENRNARGRIRMLEEEVARWQLVADMVTEIDPNPFEEGSYAMLRGKQVRYLMRSREITLGRRTDFKAAPIDADLSLEGSTYKVSRRQATIQLRTLGDFAIKNHGKHAFFVDGRLISSGEIGRLSDQSVIEISRLRFVFLVNSKVMTEYISKQIRIEVKREMGDLQKLARAIKAASAASAAPGSSSPSTSAAAAQIYALAAQNSVVDAVLAANSGMGYLSGSSTNGGSTTPTSEPGSCPSPLPFSIPHFMESSSNLVASEPEPSPGIKSAASSTSTSAPLSASRSQSPAFFGSVPPSPAGFGYTPFGGSRSASPSNSNASATPPKSASPASFLAGSRSNSPAECSSPSVAGLSSGAGMSSGATTGSPNLSSVRKDSINTSSNSSSGRKDSTSAIIEAVVSGLSLVPSISPLPMTTVIRPPSRGPIVRPYIQQPPPYVAAGPLHPPLPILPFYRHQMLPPPPPYVDPPPPVPGGSMKAPMQFGDLTIRPGFPPEDSSAQKQ